MTDQHSHRHRARPIRSRQPGTKSAARPRLVFADIEEQAYRLAASFLDEKLEGEYADLSERDRDFLEMFLADITSSRSLDEFSANKESFEKMLARQTTLNFSVSYERSDGKGQDDFIFSPAAAKLAIEVAENLEDNYKRLLNPTYKKISHKR